MKTFLAFVGGITLVALAVGALLFSAIILLRRVPPVAPQAASPTARPQPTAIAVAAQPERPSASAYRLLVTNVFDPCTTDMIFTPVPNTRVVGIEVAFFNDSAPTEAQVNPLDFSLIGTDGLPYAPHLGSCDRQIMVADLLAGESIRGEIGFDLPAGVKAKAIRFRGLGMDTFIEVAIP